MHSLVTGASDPLEVGIPNSFLLVAIFKPQGVEKQCPALIADLTFLRIR